MIIFFSYLTSCLYDLFLSYYKIKYTKNNVLEEKYQDL